MIRLKRLYAHNFKQLQEVELKFPDAARILVQGKNEAGKSTLFEAVFFALFGNALASETGTRGLDALIAYGTEKARVELDLSCDGREFMIARTIVHGKPNVWELDVQRQDLSPEEIRGNNAVNKRLIAELGFDGEALLNTCFVEQKKLEKLEGMSKAKREESLAKLLNLDAIVDLENNLKVRGEDRQELERLRKRSELADIQMERPDKESELASVEGKLRLIELARAVQGATDEMRTVQKLDASICELAAKRDAAAERAERIEALKEGMLAVKEARDAVERVHEVRLELERQRAERNEALQIVQDSSKSKEQARELHRLANHIRRLDEVRSAGQNLSLRSAQLAGVQERLETLNRTIAEAEEALGRAGAHRKEYQVGEALGAWITARQAVADRGRIEDGVAAKTAERARVSSQFRVEIYGLVALIVIFGIAAVVLQPLLPLLIALGALGAIALIVRITISWRELARVSEELGQAQGQAKLLAAENDARMAQLHETETRLSDLGANVPDTIDAAQARRVDIVNALQGKTLAELDSEQDAIRERLTNARAVFGELQQQHSLVDSEPLQDNINRCERRSKKAAEICARWETRLTAIAQSYSLDLDKGVIEQHLYQMDARAQQAEKRAADIKRIDQEIARREEQAQVLSDRARQAFERARSLKADAAEWDPRMTAGDFTAFGKELRAEYDSLGGEAIVKQAREIEGELGRRQGERDTRAKNAGILAARTAALLAEMGQAGRLSDPPELGELVDLGERLKSTDLGNENALRPQQRQLVGRLHSLRDRQDQLERELGLAGQVLDPAACRAEMEEKAHQMLVRERGVEIVSLARRRIVHKVLPATMDYMRVILPTLTRDRYHDAQLDPETYKIQVWDERASTERGIGAFKEKNIFSGGTKDQFSLALRLAFALATLPQERGTAPSFIFLDEPLGSFDQERAEALIYLLTEGEIARAFDQIFLISHVHIDERLFTHRVILENGRVQYSDLPS